MLITTAPLRVTQIDEFHASSSRRRIVRYDPDEIFIRRTIGEIQISEARWFGMTGTARTVFIKDICLDTVIRRVFIRGGLPKTLTDTRQIQHIHHAVAIDIGIEGIPTVSDLPKRSGDKQYSPRCLG